MGIPTPTKNFIFDHFPNCRKKHAPSINLELVSQDMMRHMRSTIPDYIVTGNDVVRYFAKKITSHFHITRGCMVVCSNFDLGSPGVKKIVTHTIRKEWRCAICRKLPGKECSTECSNKVKCVDKEPFHFKDGPYIVNNLDKKLPFPTKFYSRYSADSLNLRCQLYPLIVNELLKFTPPKEFQKLILNGLPFNTAIITPDDFLWETGYKSRNSDERMRVIPWEEKNIP